MVVEVVFYIFLSVMVWFFSAILLLLLVYYREFKRFWLEPMLRESVVIFDSDDWGVGPLKQSAALSDLRSLLLQYQDKRGRHPVLTLGLVLAEPDIERMRKDSRHYYRRDITIDSYNELLKVMAQGQEQGVFALHLHGMEHYWPKALMKQRHLKEVEQWLIESREFCTEDLPSHLQSRWCDSSVLPSVALESQAIEEAIADEIKCFRQAFLQAPKVLVPPTFVWTDAVIEHYLRHDISIFITPGRQYTGRNAQGDLQSGYRDFYNGECDQEGACYLVRDIYFEPEKGHKAERVVQDIQRHAILGRPSLIEMHRFNFLLNNEHSLKELKTLLDSLTQQISGLVYCSAEELMAAYKANNQEFLFNDFFDQLAVWIKRVIFFIQTKRLAKYSGLNGICAMLNSRVSRLI